MLLPSLPLHYFEQSINQYIVCCLYIYGIYLYVYILSVSKKETRKGKKKKINGKVVLVMYR